MQTYQKYKSILSGGSDTTKVINATLNLGGINTPKSYPIGSKIEDIITDLISPVIQPTLMNNYSLSISQIISLSEVGSNINQLLTYSFVRGLIQNGDLSTPVNLKGLEISKIWTNAVNGQVNITVLPGNNTVNLSLDFSSGIDPYYDSNHNVSTVLDNLRLAGSVSASTSTTGIYPFFFGELESNNNLLISDKINSSLLTKLIELKSSKNLSINVSNKHIIFCYDSAYGLLTSIKDANGFENISNFSKSNLVLNSNTPVWSKDYNIYISNSPVTINQNFNFIF